MRWLQDRRTTPPEYPVQAYRRGDLPVFGSRAVRPAAYPWARLDRGTETGRLPTRHIGGRRAPRVETMLMWCMPPNVPPAPRCIRQPPRSTGRGGSPDNTITALTP